jgi:hypothetical protein
VSKATRKGRQATELARNGEVPYGWELIVHKHDGTAETIHRVAKTEAAAKRLAMKVRKAESVHVQAALTREQYHASYGNPAISAH